MLAGLPPLVAPDCRLLVLGSFPGVASLAAQQYYGHPRNHFWPLVLALLPARPGVSVASSYAERTQWLMAQGVGLWDVYAACEREGSLDADIRNAQRNDFAALARQCPQLRAIAHNGGESYRHYRVVEAALSAAGPPQGAKAPLGLSAAAPSLPAQAWTARRGEASGLATYSEDTQVPRVGVQFFKLPSSSPANASWSFERKLAAWREVFDPYLGS